LERDGFDLTISNFELTIDGSRNVSAANLATSLTGHGGAFYRPSLSDPLLARDVAEERDHSGRKRYELDDSGFDEVPKKYRRFYRRWGGEGDLLAPNEVLCPVCKVVIRSTRELRPGDKVYCMPCMSRLVVMRGESGRLEALVTY
jgi:hypothetical protein